MAKKVRQSMAREVEANRLYQRADDLWSQGKLRIAFRLFLAAAKADVVPAFNIVASFYDKGSGVRANERAALHWYRRAYEAEKNPVAANNIGCIWRDRNQLTKARLWLRRAVKLGDDDANLNIAKIYLRTKDQEKAIHYLNKTRKSRRVTEGSKEEARLLLKQLKSGEAKRRVAGPF